MVMSDGGVRWLVFNQKATENTKVPGARASRYRVYGVIGLHIGNYPNYLPMRDRARAMRPARYVGPA